MTPARPAGLASMRPRVFPAEDVAIITSTINVGTGFNEAAGIPRGRHALPPLRRPHSADASMRPRVFPAEDAF